MKDNFFGDEDFFGKRGPDFEKLLRELRDGFGDFDRMLKDVFDGAAAPGGSTSISSTVIVNGKVVSKKTGAIDKDNPGVMNVTEEGPDGEKKTSQVSVGSPEALRDVMDSFFRSARDATANNLPAPDAPQAPKKDKPAPSAPGNFNL